jgi:hypothetical protein
LGGLGRNGRAGYQRGRFLSVNEKSFLRTLDVAIGRNYRTFAQVRLAELAEAALGANPAARRQALTRVMAKSVDFVICDVLTLDPVAAIEVVTAAICCPNGASATPSSMRCSPKSAYPSCASGRGESIRSRNCKRCASALASSFRESGESPLETHHPRRPVLGGIAIFAPDQGAALTRSVVHGFG